MSGCSCYYNKWLFFSFQTMYVVLPGLLDCNPFGTESASEQCRRAVGVCVCAVCVMPEAVRRVVSVFQTTSDLLQQYQVHSEIQSQMFAYLFFFTNVSLFNQLIDKGLFKLSDLLCFCVAHTVSRDTQILLSYSFNKHAAMATTGHRYNMSAIAGRRKRGWKAYK